MNIKFNWKIKRFLSGFIAVIMLITMLPATPVYAKLGNTVYSYDGYEVEYFVLNEWNNGQTIQVKVTNTSDESIFNWAFKYDAKGEISNLWNAVVYDNQDTNYIIKNSGWNYEIAPKQSINFGYTLVNDEFSLPDKFELCSKRVDIASGYDIDFNIVDEWNTGFKAEINIVNTSDNPLEAWILEFDANFKIDNLWGGHIAESNENHYKISSEMWTNSISTGETKTIGFVASKSIQVEADINNFLLSSVIIQREEYNLPDFDTDTIDLGYIEKLVESEIVEVIQDNNGYIRTIDGKFTNKTINSIGDAVNIFNCASTLFGNSFHANESDISIQKSGTEIFYKYSPSINGIPVFGSQIILASNNGTVTGLFSTYDKRIETINTMKTITNDIAIETALNDLFKDNYKLIDTLIIDSGLTREEIISILINALEINSLLAIYTDTQETPELVWIVSLKNKYIDYDTEVDFEDIYSYSKYVLSFINNTYYIYANGNNAGEILYIDSNIRDWESTTANANDLLGINHTFNVEYRKASSSVPEMYRLRDSERKIETYKTDFYLEADIPKLPGSMFQSDNNIWNNAASVSVHTNMAKIYDYYKNILNWKSFDGNGGTIKSSLDYHPYGKESWNNAYWTRNQFIFGNKGNFPAALDVVAHEYTHAVIDYMIYETNWIFTTRGLKYKGETGALNEAYADILGSIIEGKSKSNDGRWQIGEDTGREVRNIATPSRYYYADKYSDFSSLELDKILERAENRDNEGVHIFSTIFSLAAYKMMTDSRTISISDEMWAKIFFNSMNRLTPTSKFLDARGAIISTAKNFGLNQSEQQAIKDAFDSVEIIEPNTIRIVLTWGAIPNDLDSHLIGPKVKGIDSFHIYYMKKNYYEDNTYDSSNSSLVADLDYDSMSPYGSEVTSIRKLTPGNYCFYVQDYSNLGYFDSNILSNSEAIVKIYKGFSNKTLKLADGVTDAEFKITTAKKGTLWIVCRIYIDLHGNVSITPVNVINNSNGVAIIGG